MTCNLFLYCVICGVGTFIVVYFFVNELFKIEYEFLYDLICYLTYLCRNLFTSFCQIPK